MSQQSSHDLLTTREAAELLGVGTTSVKRWADQGLLRCVKTPGGHRRIARDSIAAFLRTSSPAANDERVDDWLGLLIDGTDPDEVCRELAQERSRHPSWLETADQLAAVLTELGHRWETGLLDVLAEHLASERLARGLARCAAEIQVQDPARTGLLVTAPGEDHTLGLSLLEPCLRESGWATRWAGRRTPSDHLERFIDSGAVQLVAVSASAYSADSHILARHANRLAQICSHRGVQLLIGGHGSWPSTVSHGHRVHSFCELRSLL